MPNTIIEEFKRTWLTSTIGIVLFFVSAWILITNEGRVFSHSNTLEEAHNNVVALNPFEPIRPELDGHLIHISGNLLIDEPLTEPDYGISIQSVKLKRRVQMYQWVEETNRKDFGDSVVQQNSEVEYYYVTEWRDKLVDSRNFYIRHGHHNPTEKPLQTYIWVSPFVKIGQLTLGTDLKQKFEDYIEVTGDQRPERRDIKLHMGIYYHCDDVWEPKVGDIRVQFYYAGLNGEPVTIIAMQKDGVLIPYKTSRGHDIGFLRSGILTVPQVFSLEHHDLTMETWKFRGIGTFIMYASVLMTIKLICVIWMNTPVLKMYYNGLDTFSTFISAVCFSIIFISVAWLFHHPYTGVTMMLIGFLPIIIYFLSIPWDRNDARNRRQN